MRKQILKELNKIKNKINESIFHPDDEKELEKLSNSEIDSYYSGPSENPKLEKDTEILFRKSKCKPNKFFSDSPSLSEVMNSKDKVIRIGHMGEDVAIVQKMLDSLGYDLGRCGIDGLFGPKTKKAVESFQSDNNISPITSCIDQNTLNKIVEIDRGDEIKPKKAPKPTSKKDDVDKTQNLDVKKVDKGSYDQYEFRGYLIYIPKNYKSKDVHVLFCGMHTTQDSGFVSLYKNAVNSLLDRVAVVITHSYHGNNFGDYVDKVQNFLNKNGFDLKINTIAGFSRGGNPVWPHVGDRSNLKFVGLIDPSTTEYDVDFGSNTLMECNPNQWGKPGSNYLLYKTLEWYCDHKNDPKYRGKIFCVDKSHSSIMSTFYQKYGYRI